MKTDAEELRLQIDSLRSELAAIRTRIEMLKRRRDGKKSNLSDVMTVTLGAVLAFTFLASAQVSHVPGKLLPGRRLQNSTVHAPFAIRDEHDEAVFIVREAAPPPPKVDDAKPPKPIDPRSRRGAYVCNHAGAPVATMQAIDGGGAVRAMDAVDPQKGASIAAAGEIADLSVVEGSTLVHVITDATGANINAFAGADFPVAGLIANPDGKGVIAVFDAPSKKPLVDLTENQLGAGEIVGLDASMELVGWYIQGGPSGAVGWVTRKKRAYFMGDRVLLK
jgi:hypothetical protein